MSIPDRLTRSTKAVVGGGAILSTLLVVGSVTRGTPAHAIGLRTVLVLMAVGEGAGAFAGIFRARSMAEATGRPYDPAYHGVRQDFGFYNLAVGLLLVLGAANPERNAVALPVAIVLYAVHGGTHLLRYLGAYYGGETPVATRPRELELRDALPLLTALAGLLVFHPS